MTYPDYETLSITTDERGVCTLELARPDVHNALNDVLIAEMRDAIKHIGQDENIRVVVLTGQGKSFCAGGDLGWFSKNMDKTRAERMSEGSELAKMLRDIDTVPKPVIGRINGQAFGGGVGMISVCDIAIGIDSARFGLTEVRLGMIPATISPYVVAKIGKTNARRTFLSGARFDANKARDYNLLNEVVAESELDEAVEREIKELLLAAPGAIASTKLLIAYVASHNSEENMTYTATRLADTWETEEAMTGVRSFLNKQTPPWQEKK